MRLIGFEVVEIAIALTSEIWYHINHVCGSPLLTVRGEGIPSEHNISYGFVIHIIRITDLTMEGAK